MANLPRSSMATTAVLALTLLAFAPAAAAKEGSCPFAHGGGELPGWHSRPMPDEYSGKGCQGVVTPLSLPGRHSVGYLDHRGCHHGAYRVSSVAVNDIRALLGGMSPPGVTCVTTYDTGGHQLDVFFLLPKNNVSETWHPTLRVGGLKEFSVVYTDRALNHMSAPFIQVMQDLNGVLNGVYNAAATVILPGSGTFAMEAGFAHLSLTSRSFASQNTPIDMTAGVVHVCNQPDTRE
jgi:hypothetical protein